MMKNQGKNHGYAFILVIFSVVLTAILITAVLTMIDIFLNKARFTATVTEMNDIKTAIIGNLSLFDIRGRTNFGYVGDMGNLPVYLNDLVTQGGQPDFKEGTVSGMAMGWNGPYMNAGFSEDPDGYKKDAWGTEYNYDAGLGTITSAGSDKTFSSGSGYAQDITVAISSSEYLADILGSVTDSSGSPITDPSWLTVRLYYPNQGVENYAVCDVTADGMFIFNNIPVGRRAVVLEPLKSNLGGITEELIILQPLANNVSLNMRGYESGVLYYVQGSSITFGSKEQIVEIDAGNSDNVNDIVITGLRVTWEGGPNWEGDEPQVVRIYTDSTVYWEFDKKNDGQNGAFIDLIRDIVIPNNSILNNLKMEFGVIKSKEKVIPVNMETTVFSIEAYFEAGQNRKIFFATP